MTNYITLEDVKQMLESNMETLEYDFENEEYGEKAKLIHKHYKNILALLNKVKPESKTGGYTEAKAEAFRND